MTRQERPSSPPVEFPVYGLRGWDGPQWIESFGDRIGDPVARVCLAHQAPDDRSVVMVDTVSRGVLDAQADRNGLDRLAEAANIPAIVLVNLTLPESSAPRSDGMLRALVEHANYRCARHADWPVISWRVDGVPVPARVWWFAGGWAAFSDALPDVYLTAAGVANGPDGVEFARLRTGEAYDFDLAGRLSIRVVVESNAEKRRRDLVRSADWHPDQVRLLPAQGS